eukprot:g32711.t1
MLVRQLLEHWGQFWSPSYRKDIIKLERLQKRFTRMLPGMEGLSYNVRLDRLGLLSLECRRLRDILQPPLIIQDRIELNRLVHLRCVVRTGEANEILWFENGYPIKGGYIYEMSIDNKTLTINAPQLPSCVLYTCVVRNKVSENRNSHLFLIE